MNVVAWFLVLWAALAQAERGVLVRGPLQVEAVPAISQLSPERLKGAEAVWVWSPVREPRRLAAGALATAKRPLFGEVRTILVRVPLGPGKMAAGLRLIAAPVEMWREVPEPLLPSWSVPKSGRLEIPVDASRPWRMRIAGEGEGSVWTDLAPGARSAVLSVVPAAGAASALVTSTGKPATGGSVRVFEGGGSRLGGTKDWAFLIAGETGRFAVPGLPDRSAFTWLASAQGHPPKRVVSTASRLPETIVLADGTTVAGRLLDTAGRPVAGSSAQVDAWASAEAPISFAVKVETDAQGRFVATAVPPGKAMLSIRKAGWAALRQPIEVPREGLDLGALSLTRGDSLAVRTVDDAGEPIAGAEVQADLGEPATTGPGGTAVLVHLPEQVEIRVRATAKGHLASDPRGVQVPASGPLELRLPRSFTVKGRFVSADGAPLADAAVKMTRGRFFESASLEPDGSFSLPLRPAQDYTLMFTSPQSASLEVPVAEGAPGEERDLGDLRAAAAGEVAGRLVDGATGEPVPGARIWTPRPSSQGALVAWMSRDLLDTTSAPDGAFRLRGLPPGPATLRIEASGFAKSQRRVDVPGEGSADLGDLPLSRGTTLTVATGIKADGAVVFLDPGSERLPFDRLMSLVHDGLARVEQVPAGTSRISVNKGSAILCEKEIQVPAGVGELSVECPAEGIVVRGGVTLGGRPSGVGDLVWQKEAGPVPEGVIHFKTETGLAQDQVFTANAPAVDVPVEAGGAFASGDLRPGTWQVVFQPEGGGTTEVQPVTLSAEKEQSVSISFPGFSVTGIVVDSAGSPVEAARVRETEGGTTTLAAKEGSFRFDGLKEKTYFFRATKDEASSEPMEVSVGEGRPKEPIVLALREGDRKPALEVHVADELGAPASGAFVFVDLPGRGLRVLTADSSGSASLLLDPPYPATVRVAARIGSQWALGAWQPFGRDPAALSLVPGPTGSLSLQAGKSAGLIQVAAPDGWNLTLLLSQLGMPPILEPGETLEIAGVPAGTYRLDAAGTSRSAVVKTGERSAVSWP